MDFFCYLFNVSIILASGFETNFVLQNAKKCETAGVFMFQTEFASLIGPQTRSNTKPY